MLTHAARTCATSMLRQMYEYDLEYATLTHSQRIFAPLQYAGATPDVSITVTLNRPIKSGLIIFTVDQ